MSLSLYNTNTRVKSNQIKFICDTKQNIDEYDIIIRQMWRQDTKAVPTALTGALGSLCLSKNGYECKINEANIRTYIIHTCSQTVFQFFKCNFMFIL